MQNIGTFTIVDSRIFVKPDGTQRVSVCVVPVKQPLRPVSFYAGVSKTVSLEYSGGIPIGTLVSVCVSSFVDEKGDSRLNFVVTGVEKGV